MAQMFGGSLSRGLLGLTLGASVALGAAPGIAARAALAQEDAGGSTYTVEIPAKVELAKAGWNATAGISELGSLASDKRLTVTAASTNGWALKSGENAIGYNLATAEGTYGAAATPASWEFSADELAANGGATKPMGIIVDDYSSKPAGAYQDTVTFTAKVETLVTMTIAGINQVSMSASITYVPGETWQQAITNHPLENVGWETDGGVRYESGGSDLHAVFDRNDTEINSNAVIVSDSSHYYLKNIEVGPDPDPGELD